MNAPLHADLDDTLVLTADADQLSHAAVLAQLSDHAPALNPDAVLAAWKLLFAAAPWDVTHQARILVLSPRNISNAAGFLTKPS